MPGQRTLELLYGFIFSKLSQYFRAVLSGMGHLVTFRLPGRHGPNKPSEKDENVFTEV